ncbi:CHAP domain-containing protein [Selenomonas sp. AE3005]|uniref:SH3 domain-containing protein n=1 Tax=Selenomonas sp. AE3005 TaxID=1485543 RepID=UPI0025E0A0D1|nr:CHAP domain-containing protein [Selenomonas sp. AE3005]
MVKNRLKKIICAGLLGGTLLIGNMVEAGVVTDCLPLSCYVDHKVITYNSPGGKSAGYISANVDLIQIMQVRGDGWCYGSYPGAGGKRVSRWFKITDVCADSGYTNKSVNVKGKQTVYRTHSGGATLGSVSNNEGVIVIADNGSRAQIVYRLDSGNGYKLGWVPSSSVQAPATVQQSHNPEGNFEGVSSPAANQIRIEGWVADRDNMAESLRIHVYVGGAWNSGAESYEILANKSRPDVKHFFNRQGISAGEFYGFNSVINVKRTGNQPIYVYAINVGGGGNIELGHKIVDVKAGTQAVVQERQGYIKTNGANLYFRAVPGGQILGKLASMTAVTVLQHPAANGWSKIRYNGKEGYVASQYVLIGTVPKYDNKIDAAMRYIANLEGKAMDYDGVYGAQCVDLIKYYYKYLGVANYARGNGKDYATNTLPPNWQRIKGAEPKKGDILVYTTGGGGYGHVAIAESPNVSWHQNFNGKYVRKITGNYRNIHVGYWGVIRPVC